TAVPRILPPSPCRSAACITATEEVLLHAHPSTGINRTLPGLAEGFHDFGHGVVGMFRQHVYDFQNFVRSMVFPRVRFQILLTRGKLSPFRAMGEIGR